MNPLQPSYEYDTNYYYNVANNTIYGPEKYTYGYFHELSHHNDYQNEWYKKLNFKLTEHFEIVCLVALALLPVAIWSGNWSVYTGLVTLLMSPVILFIAQEEVRAIIYGRWKHFMHTRA